MKIDIDSARFSYALRMAIFWPIGVILAASLLLLLVVFTMLDEVHWTNHSYQVLTEIRQCESEMIGSQNELRGYLLTGDDKFTSRFESDRAHAMADLAHIRGLVASNPEQVHNIESIIQAFGTWLAQAKILVSHRTARVAVDPDEVRMGSTILEDVKARFAHAIGTELDRRDAHLHHVRRMKVVLASASAALALLLTFTIVYQVRRQMLELASGYRAALETTEQRHGALLRSERDLEEQKEWLRVTLTSIADGVMVTDAAGRVVLMNHEAERLTGWNQSEALHQALATVFQAVREDSRAPLANPIAGDSSATANSETIAPPALLLSRKGEEWSIDHTAAPIRNADGKLLGGVLVFRDSTRLRAAQKSLQAYSSDLEKIVAERTVALQETVKELEVFSYTVSHDLRSPLRAMQGFSEALLEDYGAQLDEQGRHFLARIQSAAARLDRLIQDLLTYTRISRQDQPLEPLDLDKIVRDVIELDPHLKPPAAEIHMDGALPRVLGRETPLIQVVSNLLGNAARFVRNGETPSIHIWHEDRGPRVRLMVEDKGLGIPEADRERIFDMFVQINDPAKFGGTGAGLAIVKKAVSAMRGTVGVEAAPGGGSRFWVELARA